MYLKRLLAFLCCFTLVFCLFPSSAFATGGNGNIDGGGGSMGHGTSSNFWNSGNDGVRITAMLITIIAPPDIFDEIHIHLTAAVTTKRAIHIYTVCLSASDS